MPAFPFLIISDRRQVDARHPSKPRALHFGYRGWRPRGLRGPGRRSVPLETLIPRADWPARIAALAGNNLHERYPLFAKDQDGLSYCWAYGSTRAAETERLRLGLPSLDLCPESVAGPCTNWRNEGGYAAEYFGRAESDGIAESRLCPAPHELDPRRWDPTWQANARSHHVLLWYDIQQGYGDPTFDELITCLLSPMPLAIGLPWWGHLVCALAALVLPPDTDCPANTPTGDKIGVLIQNSWGPDWPRDRDNGYAVLVESLATPDGAACPVVAE